ncbi:rna-directed dna polymerase from mobile element jockey-like [Pitangus sulphuratus]|nr:rna-directed dna polymerase from mobile element jockey-like [Pitangus sulphuratus]
MSKQRPAMSGVSGGLLLGLVLFNIFVSDMGSGIESPLRKFTDDTKLSGAVDTLEGRDVNQRDLERFERWTCAKLMKFNKAKCKVLPMGWSNTKHKYRLGREHIESRHEEKDFEVLVDDKFNMTQQLYPGLYQKKCGQQVMMREMILPCYAISMTPHLEYCI